MGLFPRSSSRLLPDSFEIVREARVVVAVRRDRRDTLVGRGALAFERTVLDPRNRVRSRRGRTDHGSVVLPEGDGECLFVRQYRHGGLLGGLLRGAFLGTRRPFGEIRMVEEAREGGLATPSLVAVLGRRRALLYRWFAVQEELGGFEDLQELLLGIGPRPRGRALARKRALLRGAARAVRALHALGIYHADLHLKNLMAARDGGDEVAVVDLDKSRGYESLSRRLRIRNLVRLDRSVEKLNLCAGGVVSRSDRWRFFRAYSAGEEWSRAGIEWILASRRRSLARHRWIWRVAAVLGSGGGRARAAPGTIGQGR